MNNAIKLKEKYIKKHNAAIRSYSEMSLLQRKLANALLYNAYHNLEEKDFHEITISQLLTILSMRTNDYKKLKQTIIQLMSTVIEWNVINKIESKNNNDIVKLFDSKESWKACTLLSSVQIDGTTIKYEYSNILRELFYRPSFYSKISLDIQNKFKSLYSLSLYENCLSYLNCGSSGWITFEMFRKIMGVGQIQYKEFRDFSRRVLKPAILEVNKSSDIVVNYEIRKSNRIPSHIKLAVFKGKIVSEELINKDNKDSFIKNKLLEYGFSEKDAIKTINEYDKGNICEKISIIEESGTKIKIPAAFLKAALKNDYKKNIAKNQVFRNTYLDEIAAEKRKEKLGKEYKLYVDQVYRNWLLQLNEEEKTYLLGQVREYHESQNMPFWKKARSKIELKTWLEDLDVFLSIKIYMITEKSDLQFENGLPQILSMEQWISDSCKIVV